MKQSRSQFKKNKQRFIIDIANLSSRPVPTSWQQHCTSLVKRVFLLTKVVDAEISLVFVKPQLIRRLNFKYRHQNKVTDVLAFIYQNAQKKINGEILICLNQAKLQAIKNCQTLIKEISMLAVHGALHLAGYDHQTNKQQKIMKSLENKILN
ncbi:MAG: rRNA maturation RNase YbeY [Patescibacteria group bacterium]